MDRINISELKRIMKHPGQLSISIYIPTSDSGADMDQNRMTFEKAVDEAERLLKEKSEADEKKVNLLLGAGRKRLTEKRFWCKQDQGLAVFLSPGFSSFYRLPIAFKELVVVGDRFYLRPLLPFFLSDAGFYVIAVSLESVRLFEYLCRGQYLVKRTEISDVVSFISSHNPQMDNTERLLKYFDEIHKAVYTVLKEENRPLLFAGTDELYALFKQTNRYPYTMSEPLLLENPKSLIDAGLQEKIWEVASKDFKTQYRKAIEKYLKYRGKKKTGTDLRIMMQSAMSGRVDYLLMKANTCRWGYFNRLTGNIAIHDKQEPSDEDLIDVVLFETLLHGGKIYTIAPDHMPGDEQIFAFYRF